MTEIARCTRRGFSPSREAGLFGFSPCCSVSAVVHAFYRQSHGGTFPGRPEDGAFRCRQYGSVGTPPSRKAVPAAVAPVPPIRLPCRSREPAGLQPTRSVRGDILIVDDDRELRHAVRFLLEHEGYHVHEAASGQQALDVLRTSPRRMVVLLDIRMPGMSGMEVVEQMVERIVLSRHAYILLTAQYGKTTSLNFTHLVSKLAIPVITKPFNITQLLAAVEQAAHRLP